MSPPSTKNIASLCAELGIHHREFDSAYKRGVFPRSLITFQGKHRKIVDYQGCLNAYRAYIGGKTGTSIRRAEEIVRSGVDFQDPSTWPRDAEELKVVKAFHDATLAQQKASRQSGELLPKAEVERHLFGAARACRAALEQMPTRIADALASQLGADARKVRKALDKEIGRALTDLAKKLEKLGSEAMPEDE